MQDKSKEKTDSVSVPFKRSASGRYKLQFKWMSFDWEDVGGPTFALESGPLNAMVHRLMWKIERGSYAPNRIVPYEQKK